MKYDIIELFRNTFQAIDEHKAIYYDYETYTETLVEDIATRVANLTDFSKLFRGKLFKVEYRNLAVNLRKLEGDMSKEDKIKWYTILSQDVKWFFRDFILGILQKSLKRDIDKGHVYVYLVYGSNKVSYNLCSTLESNLVVKGHCKRLATELVQRWYQHVDDLQFFYTSTVFLESLLYTTEHSLAVDIDDTITPLTSE